MAEAARDRFPPPPAKRKKMSSSEESDPETVEHIISAGDSSYSTRLSSGFFLGFMYKQRNHSFEGCFLKFSVQMN